jgi:hypothetical protein
VAWFSRSLSRATLIPFGWDVKLEAWRCCAWVRAQYSLCLLNNFSEIGNLLENISPFIVGAWLHIAAVWISLALWTGKSCFCLYSPKRKPRTCRDLYCGAPCQYCSHGYAEWTSSSNNFVLLAGEESILFRKLSFVQHTDNVLCRCLKLRACRICADVLTLPDTAYRIINKTKSVRSVLYVLGPSQLAMSFSLLESWLLLILLFTVVHILWNVVTIMRVCLLHFIAEICMSALVLWNSSANHNLRSLPHSKFIIAGLKNNISYTVCRRMHMCLHFHTKFHIPRRNQQILNMIIPCFP